MDQYQNWHHNIPVDLKNCQDEPIRIPGAVQPFGFLIAFEKKSGRLQAVSENAFQALPGLKGFPEKTILIEELAKVRESSDLIPEDRLQKRRRVVEVELVGREGTPFYGAMSSSGDLEVLEVETQSSFGAISTGGNYLANLPLMLQDVHSHSTVETLSVFVAAKIKAITGFDRVMIYRYDHEWNGEVIAEAKEERLEAFLGLHYPASDIPAQARALYERNWIRIIPTVHYQPIRIVPESFARMDLSDSVLRSVSPIHIRYLRNMGVGASMSISLIVEGKLWGLIACHHYSDHYVPLNIRAGCEAYGQLVSWHLKSIETTTAAVTQLSAEAELHEVLREFSEEKNLQFAAKSLEPKLLSIFECTGMIIRLGEQVVRIGEDPGDVICSAVGKALLSRSILDPLVTDEVRNLPELEGADANPAAAGVMALALSPKHNYFVICARPEEKRTVNWAGNPHTKTQMNFDDPDQRLAPRGSFALWQELHEGRSAPWSHDRIEILKKFGLLFFKMVVERKELAEQSNNELKALNQAKDEFVATVSHELRTPLNAIIGWTDLALSGELENARLPEALKIIQRNARSQNQLVGDLLDVSRIISGKMKLSVQNMRISEVTEAVVLSFQPAADAKNIKIIFHGDDTSDSIIGDPNRIQQVIWNLLSNAMKFSPKNSKIWIQSHRLNSQMELTVRDQGIGIAPGDFEKIFGRFQQVDSSPARKSGGLGLGLSISKHIVELHGGTISVFSEGEGMGSTFKVYFPISPLKAGEDRDELPIDDHFEENKILLEKDTSLKGETILVVEDEPDAVKFLQLLLGSHGAKIYTAFNGQEGMDMLEKYKDEIGLVLSDVGMPILDGYQMISKIRASADPKINSIPAVALTAFGRPQDRVTALKSGFDSYIAKPVLQAELMAVLGTLRKNRNR